MKDLYNKYGKNIIRIPVSKEKQRFQKTTNRYFFKFVKILRTHFKTRNYTYPKMLFFMFTVLAVIYYYLLTYFTLYYKIRVFYFILKPNLSYILPHLLIIKLDFIGKSKFY